MDNQETSRSSERIAKNGFLAILSDHGFCKIDYGLEIGHKTGLLALTNGFGLELGHKIDNYLQQTGLL